MTEILMCPGCSTNIEVSSDDIEADDGYCFECGTPIFDSSEFSDEPDIDEEDFDHDDEFTDQEEYCCELE